MRELTNSMRCKFNSCHRAFKICYEDLVRPVKTSDALSFGTAMHSLLEGYWGGEEAEFVTTGDEYNDMTVKSLYEGYVRYYGEQDKDRYVHVGAELRFDVPLINPETMKPSQTWKLSGKIDAIAIDKDTDQPVIVEHKTTSMDIGLGSDYWRKLPIDGQVSGYFLGAQSLGHKADSCLYDVIRKPTIKPARATPMESRKYTKDGKLYASCREFDETPEDWFLRLSADIDSRPEFYFQRMTVVRSSNDLEEYLFDMWAVGREIADAERANRWSRNPQACSVFGHCEYYDVCTGCASLDDVTLFRKAERANEEL